VNDHDQANPAPPRLEIPEVSRTTDCTVVVELTPSQARVLARVLAHYEVIATAPRPGDAVMDVTRYAADGYDPDVWQHTLIRLLAEAANARTELHAPTAVLVPFLPRGAHR